MTKRHDSERPPYGAAFQSRFWITQLAALLLNPRGLVFAAAQAGGQLIAWARLLSAGGLRLAPVGLHFPLDGDWRVLAGGVTRETSHSWGLLAQRYAYDFVRDPPPADPPRALDGWPAFGAEVRAAAPGRVVALRTNCRDHPRPGTGWIDWRAADPRGNFVVLEHAPDRYSLYAHLAAGSIAVRCGDRVSAGDPVGRVGNSGHSTEPHLHFQLQDRASFLLAVGLPPAFEDAAPVSGPPSERPGTLREDQRVAPVASAGRAAPEVAENAPAEIAVTAGVAPLWVGAVTLGTLLLLLRALYRLASGIFWP